MKQRIIMTITALIASCLLTACGGAEAETSADTVQTMLAAVVQIQQTESETEAPTEAVTCTAPDNAVLAAPAGCCG